MIQTLTAPYRRRRNPRREIFNGTGGTGPHLHHTVTLRAFVALEAGGDEPVLDGHVLVAVLALAQDLAVILGQHGDEGRTDLAAKLILQHAARDCKRERKTAARLDRLQHVLGVRR